MSSNYLPTHATAELIPAMAAADFAELKADIAAHGLQVPVKVMDGKIVDGRHRYRACQELGVEAQIEIVDDIEDAVGYVISLNVTRRHLSESQRAMIAGRIATRERGEYDRGKSANLQNKKTEAEAAEMLNVSPRGVSSSKKVLEHGIEELIAAVDRGAEFGSAFGTNSRKIFRTG